MQIFCQVLCPENSHFLALLILTTQCLQLMETVGLFWVPCPGVWPEESFQALCWKNHGVHFIYFSSLMDHCPSLPDFKCPNNDQNHYYIFSSFLIVPCWWYKSRPFYPILAGRESGCHVIFRGQFGLLYQNFKFVSFLAHNSSHFSNLWRYNSEYDDIL